MGGEEGIVAARRGRADAVRARGENPFANDVDVTDRVLVRELRERFQSALQEPALDERYDAASAKRAGYKGTCLR